MAARPVRRASALAQPQRVRRGRFLVTAAAGLTAACSGQQGPGVSSPTLLTRVALQAGLTTAVSTLEGHLEQSGAAALSSCDSAGVGADLSACQRAIGVEREARLAFDSALRNIRFPSSAAADLGALLSADSNLETLLEQASVAPSLGVVHLLEAELSSLRETVDVAVRMLRADAGLAAGP